MKGRYSQKELLLLSNFVYIPACRSDKTIGEILDDYRTKDGTFSEESVIEASRGGGMSCADVKCVFEQMDSHIEKKPDFGKLSASRRLEEKNVRAVCYTDEKDNDPVVVFRGTGGTKEAWTDNFDGAFLEDTGIQKTADDFVKYECAIYDDIVVTGHSKGGNMAQYVTVKQNDKVLECVSYDGQGFGDEMIKGNREAVASASPKITSISAYNDFVNILLTCIAGTSLYVANDPSAAGAHYSVTLLTNNSFDEEGNFTSVRSQGVVSAALKHITDLMCDILKPCAPNDKEAMSDVAGSAISLALNAPPGKIPEEVVAPTLGKITAQFIKKTTAAIVPAWDARPTPTGVTVIATDRLRLAENALCESVSDIEKSAERVNEERQNVTYSVTAKLCAEKALENVYDDMNVLGERIKNIAELAKQAALCFERAENRAAELFIGVQ